MNLQVKICGLTNIEDTINAITAGADYIGFIFANSPRQVTVDQVTGILKKVEKKNLRHQCKTVGVFVNEKQSTIESIIKQTGLDLIQLHGDEKSQEVNQYPFSWYKVFRIGLKEDVDTYFNYSTSIWHCSQILVDTKIKNLYGGTGYTIDSDLALYAQKKVRNWGQKFFLAGGINPDNVFSILTKIKPDGIDIGSGIESQKGKKSRGKMAGLFQEINRYKHLNNK